ncbi:outer membrane protein assembly factor BamA [Bacteroidales bacterium OttesenSCG-928-M11]|nr:outer membrane protein assembly factor BamA [Bacteroidales bacterium OttesenSCG-928-M11]
MHKRFLFLILAVLLLFPVRAQDVSDDVIPVSTAIEVQDTETIQTIDEDIELPVISYSLTNNKKYTIADIKITGVESYGYQDYVLIGVSGLAIGDKIEIPGEEVTNAVKAFWKYGLFSDVSILPVKMTNDSIWLEVALKPNPIVSQINYTGVKKGEKEDLDTRIGVSVGSQITPNIVNRIKKRTVDYFAEKGFNSSEVQISQRDDSSQDGRVILDIAVDKNEKTKIDNIFISGNDNISDYDLKVVMGKTNEGFSLKKRFKLSWRELFSTKKFVKEEYKTDLDNIIQKYYEKGYRDAIIVADSIVSVDDKKINIYIDIDEGNKYYIRDIKWVGNTLYSSTVLGSILDMKSGDVYNRKKMTERLQVDEDAVSSVYYNNGYIFSEMVPVEVSIEKDSVDIEVRIFEGIQATINKVVINGNDRLYEDIIRRELLTKPGQLFSKDILMRTYREIAQMGHFDPEALQPDVRPDPETGTVDLYYNLTSKANDQIEFSAGYGQTGIIGKLSLKFTNFSIGNLFNPDVTKGILPQGDGQTLTLSGQTNGRYYQSYSVSFFDPWLGKKRPNSFSLGLYYVEQTGVDDRYYENYYNNYYNYGTTGDYLYDDNTKMKIFGISAGYGKRLSWPDTYFNFMAEISYQRYWLRNWTYFIVENGNCNNLSLGLTLSRSSIDNPTYTRRGSSFSFSVHLTPPYSLWDGVDYSGLSSSDEKVNKWIEYHKWKFKGKIFIPLANPEHVKRTPVLMSRIEYGFLGSYNSNKRSPFETFYMGGDGTSGYSSTYATETIGLRGYSNGSLTPYGMEGYAYSRLCLELRYPFMLEQSATIYGLTFVEAGNAWTDIKSFNPFDLKRSAGVGVRIMLPMIGLMGLDWAYGFDKASPYQNSRNGSELHFILGQEF